MGAASLGRDTKEDGVVVLVHGLITASVEEGTHVFRGLESDILDHLDGGARLVGGPCDHAVNGREASAAWHSISQEVHRP